MLNTKPCAAEKTYLLPSDWVQQVLGFHAQGALTPLVEALQALVRKRGEAAIALEHVQELALTVCGVSPEKRLDAYERLFQILTSAVGATWPVTMPLEEQPLATKPLFDAAQGLIACDGEWLVLEALIRSQWIPHQKPDRVGHDWLVVRDSRELPVEVKTKQTEGSDLGRFQFALRGLALTPAGSYLNNFSWQWYGGQNLTRKGLSAFYELLQANLVEVGRVLATQLPLYDRVQVASSPFATLSIQRYERSAAALDFVFIDPNASAELREKNQVTVIAEPNYYPGVYRSGSAEARFLRDTDATMLDELERYVFSRLKIAEQASKRTSDTVVVLMWEMPFYWQLDLPAVEQRWRTWCSNQALANAILFPIGPFAPKVMFTTLGAKQFLPDDLAVRA
jgi:hypothetical protein